MKFVFLGYDFSLTVLERMIADGHDLCGIFTFPCDNRFNFNKKIHVLANKNNVPIFEEKATSAHIESFLAQGAELFLSAGYMHKIPIIDESRAYAVNIHPAYLPQGRGVMPTPHIIMNEPQAAGVTLHKISDRFDAGDIMSQERIEISERETVESYSARALALYPKLVSEFLKTPKQMWGNATPQDETQATHFKMPDDTMRMLDFSKSVKEIDKVARAFGRFGSLARAQNNLYVVYDHDYWEEAHAHDVGYIVQNRHRTLLIAARDGFILLKDFANLNG